MPRQNDYADIVKALGTKFYGMYGCRYRLIKKKYQKISSTPYEYIEWPEALKKHYIKEMQLLEKKAVIDRTFSPKIWL